MSGLNKLQAVMLGFVLLVALIAGFVGYQMGRVAGREYEYGQMQRHLQEITQMAQQGDAAARDVCQSFSRFSPTTTPDETGWVWNARLFRALANCATTTP